MKLLRKRRANIQNDKATNKVAMPMQDNREIGQKEEPRRVLRPRNCLSKGNTSNIIPKAAKKTPFVQRNASVSNANKTESQNMPTVPSIMKKVPLFSNIQHKNFHDLEKTPDKENIYDFELYHSCSEDDEEVKRKKRKKTTNKVRRVALKTKKFKIGVNKKFTKVASGGQNTDNGMQIMPRNEHRQVLPTPPQNTVQEQTKVVSGGQNTDNCMQIMQTSPQSAVQEQYKVEEVPSADSDLYLDIQESFMNLIPRFSSTPQRHKSMCCHRPSLLFSSPRTNFCSTPLQKNVARGIFGEIHSVNQIASTGNSSRKQARSEDMVDKNCELTGIPLMTSTPQNEISKGCTPQNKKAGFMGDTIGLSPVERQNGKSSLTPNCRNVQQNEEPLFMEKTIGLPPIEKPSIVPNCQVESQNVVTLFIEDPDELPTLEKHVTSSQQAISQNKEASLVQETTRGQPIGNRQSMPHQTIVSESEVETSNDDRYHLFCDVSPKIPKKPAIKTYLRRPTVKADKKRAPKEIENDEKLDAWAAALASHFDEIDSSSLTIEFQ